MSARHVKPAVLLQLHRPCCWLFNFLPDVPCCLPCVLPAAGASCPLYGKTEAEVGVTRTPCCHQLVCDTLYNYQIGSYTRDICPRSHKRYTLCG